MLKVITKSERVGYSVGFFGGGGRRRQAVLYVPWKGGGGAKGSIYAIVDKIAYLITN